jgi:hypothetical protein
VIIRRPGYSQPYPENVAVFASLAMICPILGEMVLEASQCARKKPRIPKNTWEARIAILFAQSKRKVFLWLQCDSAQMDSWRPVVICQKAEMLIFPFDTSSGLARSLFVERCGVSTPLVHLIINFHTKKHSSKHLSDLSLLDNFQYQLPFKLQWEIIQT